LELEAHPALTHISPPPWPSRDRQIGTDEGKQHGLWTEGATPRGRPMFGAVAMERVEAKLTALRADMETWNELSLSTGFES
jgi:hypothetical protein